MKTKSQGIPCGLALCALLLGCGDSAPVASCDPIAAPDGGATALVSQFQISEGAVHRQANKDGTCTLSVRITAAVPCLHGSTQVWLTASVGQIGGVAAGSRATVLLAPTGPEAAGVLVGQVQLAGAVGGQDIYLIAELGEAAAAAKLAACPVVDGGVSAADGG